MARSKLKKGTTGKHSLGRLPDDRVPHLGIVLGMSKLQALKNLRALRFALIAADMTARREQIDLAKKKANELADTLLATRSNEDEAWLSERRVALKD